MTDKDQMTALLLVVGSQSKKIEALMKRLCVLEARVKSNALPVQLTDYDTDIMPLPEILNKMGQIVVQVSVLYGVSKADIMGTSRLRHIINARQHGYALSRQSGRSFNAIGDYFKRDHSTIINGIKAHEKRVAAS